jgi:fimbrial chaperone protein
MRRRFFALVITALAVFAGLTPRAEAAITITPTLIVLEGRDRFADVSLLNTGGEINTYAITWQYKEMQENGSYINLSTPPEGFDLTQNIVVTPKRVTIESQKVQKVRLALRLKGEPPAPGDYKAHLYLKEASSASDSQGGQPGKVQLGVKVRMGFSIPVVYRVGESNATAKIGEAQIRRDEKTGQLQAIVSVERSDSPYGIMGTLSVYHNGEVIGSVKNANIFREVKKRQFIVGLKAQDLTTGNLRIVLKDYKADSEKIFAEKTISIK